MLGKSFRSLARQAFPGADPRKLAVFALALALAGCGGSGSGGDNGSGRRVVGQGFSFEAPASWQVKRSVRAVEARDGEALVSVTVFRLARIYRPSLWEEVVPELDRVASQLAARVHGKVESATTRTIAGERGREYAISRNGEDERIAFVLRAKREYQLYCRGAGDACDMLFDTFTLAA
jgi:hypothetical protein